MELGGSLPHSQESTTCPYPSQINPLLCPSHFWQAQLVSFLVGLKTYQHPGIYINRKMRPNLPAYISLCSYESSNYKNLFGSRSEISSLFQVAKKKLKNTDILHSNYPKIFRLHIPLCSYEQKYLFSILSYTTQTSKVTSFGLLTARKWAQTS